MDIKNIKISQNKPNYHKKRLNKIQISWKIIKEKQKLNQKNEHEKNGESFSR